MKVVLQKINSLIARLQTPLTLMGFSFFGYLLINALSNYNVVEGTDFLIIFIAFLTIIPLNHVINGKEFQEQAALVGVNIGFWDAFATAIKASLANLLPIPGSIAVRTAVLNSLGVPLKKVAYSSLIVGGAYFVSSFSLAVASLILFYLDLNFFLNIFLLLTYLTLSLAGIYFVKSEYWKIYAIEMCSSFLFGLRLAMLLKAFNLSLPLLAANVMGFGSALTGAIGIIPSGVGVVELVISLIGGFLGIDPNIGLIASSTSRLLGIISLGLIWVVLKFIFWFRKKENNQKGASLSH